MDELFHTFFQEHRGEIFAKWQHFLRYASVSTDSSFREQCNSCAKWLCEEFRQQGFSVELRETSTLPLVIANFAGDPTLPRIVVYGHYDVQPADPIAEWVSPPFEPDIRYGRMYARGAVDNKGQLWMLLSAIDASRRLGVLRNPVSIVIEGEEECGSGALTEILRVDSLGVHGEVLLVIDSTSPKLGLPCLTLGLRGLFSLELALHGANRDLHSGFNGGLAPNPAVIMAQLIASCFDKDGTVTVPGYYDGISALTETEARLLKQAYFSEEEYAQQLGVTPCGGEHGLPPLVRVGFRPTLEVNGLFSGYSGPGGKSIIPGRAGVKLTGRAARGQNPAQMLDAVESHLYKNLPPGCRLETVEKHVAGAALSVAPDAPLVALASKVCEDLCGVPPLYDWNGGSIPILSELSARTGALPLLVGFSVEQDAMHAPNESFSLAQFELGFVYVGKLLGALRGG